MTHKYHLEIIILSKKVIQKATPATNFTGAEDRRVAESIEVSTDLGTMTEKGHLSMEYGIKGPQRERKSAES